MIEYIGEMLELNPGVVIAVVAFFIMVLIAVIAAVIAAVSTVAAVNSKTDNEE